MGNTNLAQSGAAHENNSRDTRSGIEQISDAEQEKARMNQEEPVTPPHPAITPDETVIGRADPDHSLSGAA